MWTDDEFIDLSRRITRLEAEEGIDASDVAAGVAGGVVASAIASRLGFGMGPQGVPGATGRTGRPGAQGNQGVQGIQGPQGIQGVQGIQGPVGPSGFPPDPTGLFFDETATQNLYVSTTGSDTTGDGLTPGTAWATVQHALRQIPPTWTADVNVNVAAGIYTGNQTWALSVSPGSKVLTNGIGRVSVLGTTTDTPLTGGAVGAVVTLSGTPTLSVFDYAVGAYAPVVTDGSHHLRSTIAGTFLYNGQPVLASVSPNLRVVASSNAAFTTPFLSTWDTSFTGSVTVDVTTLRQAAQYFFIQAVRFQSSFTASGGFQTRVCRFDLAVTTTDVSQLSATLMAGTNNMIGVRSLFNTLTTCFTVAGSTSLSGFGSMNNCLWTGAPSLPAKLALGGISATITTALQPGVIRQFSGNDFRGTGTAVRVIGGVIHSGVATAACTIVVTGGAPLVTIDGARLFGGVTWTWVGTGDAPATLSEGSHLITSGGYQCTNSATPGLDVVVGELVVQATAVRPTTAPLQLCRYT